MNSFKNGFLPSKQNCSKFIYLSTLRKKIGTPTLSRYSETHIVYVYCKLSAFPYDQWRTIYLLSLIAESIILTLLSQLIKIEVEYENDLLSILIVL